MLIGKEKKAKLTKKNYKKTQKTNKDFFKSVQKKS